MSQAKRTINIVRFAIPAFCVLTCALMYLTYCFGYTSLQNQELDSQVVSECNVQTVLDDEQN